MKESFYNNTIFFIRSLNHRNYRLFFFGQFVSLIGTWIQQIALSWLIYRLTNSSIILGVYSFSSQIPVFLFSSFTGVLIDRLNIHRLLIITQFMSMIQAGVLFFIVYSGDVNVLHIIILTLILGCINSFDMPARHSFIVKMIDKKSDLQNAIALNSIIINGTRLIGPAIAGVLITLYSESVCFLINFLSFIAVLIALSLMHINKQVNSINLNRNIFTEFKNGFVYVFYNNHIRAIILLLAFLSFVGIPYQFLMPVYAKNVLLGGAHTLGFLLGASGLGALVGCIYLASRKNSLNIPYNISFAPIVFGIGLVLLAYINFFYIDLLIMMLTGFGMILCLASINTCLQIITDDDKRGRVMSYYTMAFIGVAPFGSLLFGWFVNIIGIKYMFCISGLSCILAGSLFSVNIENLLTLIKSKEKNIDLSTNI